MLRRKSGKSVSKNINYPQLSSSKIKHSDFTTFGGIVVFLLTGLVTFAIYVLKTMNGIKLSPVIFFVGLSFSVFGLVTLFNFLKGGGISWILENNEIIFKVPFQKFKIRIKPSEILEFRKISLDEFDNLFSPFSTPEALLEIRKDLLVWRKGKTPKPKYYFLSNYSRDLFLMKGNDFFYMFPVKNPKEFESRVKSLIS